MKQLTDFKNKHLDDDIYVYASGKSCDYIDNSFFDNKILIGVNQSYKRLKPQYLVRKEYELLKTIINDPNLDDVTHFVSRGNCGNHQSKNKEYIESHFKDKSNIVVYNHDYNYNFIRALPVEEEKLIVSASTITTTIHLAAYMGAKNIIIVGHDCGLLNGDSNFKGYHTEETITISRNPNIEPQKDYNSWLKNIEGHTITLKKLLMKKYKCNILSLNPFINFNMEGNKYQKTNMF